MQNQRELEVVENHFIGNTEFSIAIDKAAGPNAFLAHAEYFFVNRIQVSKDEYDRQLLSHRAADDAAKAQS